MKSNLMTKDQILTYIKENFDFFEKDKDLVCEEIGDGNINYVFRIKDSSGKSLVIKQADSLLRSSQRPLDTNRSKIEQEVLKIENHLAPGLVPEVYHYDEEKFLIIMEDISTYKNLRTELIEGRIYDHLPESISTFLEKTLIPTTDLVIDRKEKKERLKRFTNPDLCDITEDLVLTEPYFDYKNRNIITKGLEDFVKNSLYEDEDLHFEVLKLKDKFQNYSQGLIHGDLHSGSIFINEEGIKVIDPEFSFYGPLGYDIGNVWGNLVFPLYYHMAIGSDQKLIEKSKDIIIKTIDLTIKKLKKSFDDNITFEFFKNKKFKDFYLKDLIEDSFGYCGTEIIRRTVGDSKVKEVDLIKDLDKRLNLDKSLVLLGKEIILNRSDFKEGKDITKLIEKE